MEPAGVAPPEPAEPVGVGPPLLQRPGSRSRAQGAQGRQHAPVLQVSSCAPRAGGPGASLRGAGVRESVTLSLGSVRGRRGRLFSGPHLPITLNLLSLRRHCRPAVLALGQFSRHYKQVTRSSVFTTRDGPDTRGGTEFLAWGQAAPPSRTGCLGTPPEVTFCLWISHFDQQIGKENYFPSAGKPTM